MLETHIRPSPCWLAEYARHMEGRHVYTDPSYAKASIMAAIRKPIADILAGRRG